MKRILRFAVIFLLLCFSFRQAAEIRDLSPAVSLRFEQPFTKEQAEPFAAVWSEERGYVYGYETTLIRFGGDAQLTFPTVWLYGTPPNDLMENSCAVSTRLGWEIYGGADVTGLTVEFAGEAHTIVGVFDHKDAVLLIPGDVGFTAAELLPVPDGTDLYRYARDCAAQTGLEEPAQILCGPESASIAMLLPWLCVLLCGWPLLRRMTQGRNWLWLLVVLLMIAAIPDWFIPTRWSDTAFGVELVQSLSSRVCDWLSLRPALRDLPVKEHWFMIGWAMMIASFLSQTQISPYMKRAAPD